MIENIAGDDARMAWIDEANDRQPVFPKEDNYVSWGEAGLTKIGKSIANRQNTVAQYIVTRPLLDLCEGARAREGARVPMRWWNQTTIDWEAAKTKGGGGEIDSTSGSGSSTDGEEEQKEEREDASKASGSSGAEWSGASADEWE